RERQDDHDLFDQRPTPGRSHGPTVRKGPAVRGPYPAGTSATSRTSATAPPRHPPSSQTFPPAATAGASERGAGSRAADGVPRPVDGPPPEMVRTAWPAASSPPATYTRPPSAKAAAWPTGSGSFPSTVVLDVDGSKASTVDTGPAAVSPPAMMSR